MYKMFIGIPVCVNYLHRARSLIYTRGIWKILSMVINQFTKPIMFGIILKSYFSTMLWHKFHEDV